MHAIVAFLSGTIGLLIIVINQVKVFQSINTLYVIGTPPVVATIGIGIKLACIALAIISIIFSVQYTKLGWQKYSLINRVARFMAIVAIILCLVPIHWFLIQ